MTNLFEYPLIFPSVELLNAARPTLTIVHEHNPFPELLSALNADHIPFPSNLTPYYVFYPWKSQLIHLLPPKFHRALRSQRNRYLITSNEQDILQNKTIGIIGLSAGYQVAMSLCLESVGTKYKLADFDSLELANLSRIPASLLELGLNKSVILARRLYELDPYLDIEIYPSGITSNNLSNFLTDLDIVFEVCDSLALKLEIREAARSARIPVIMPTSDRGLLDVERFDLEPDRPIFHGLVPPNLNRYALLNGDREAKAQFMTAILQSKDISTKFLASMLEIDESLKSWPQLASSVALGGILASEITRKIFLGEINVSGRWTMDISSYLIPENRVSLIQVPITNLKCNLSDRLTSLEFQGHGILDICLRNAILAPSPGNNQPWLFKRLNPLECIISLKSQPTSPFDPDALSHYLALGAALENFILTATLYKYQTHYKIDNNKIYIQLEFNRKIDSNDLSLYIEKRATNRRLGSGQSLTNFKITEYPNIVITENKEKYAEIIGKVDRLRFLIPSFREALFNELKFETDTKDGISIASLELTPGNSSVLDIIKDGRALTKLYNLQLQSTEIFGKALSKSSEKLIQTASLLGSIVSKRNITDIIEAGRQMMNFWLKITKDGLSLQPLAVVGYLIDLQGHPDFEKIVPKVFHSEIEIIENEYRKLFNHKENDLIIFSFRIIDSLAPTVVSLRHPFQSFFID